MQNIYLKNVKMQYSDPIMIIPAQKLKFGHFQNTNFGLSDLTKSKL